jgi:nucleoside-diphosphate-sugar epimerase
MKALVTGGAGFVGRHLSRKLLLDGWDVTVVDSLVSGTGAINPEAGWPLFDPQKFVKFKFVNMDCRDYFKIISASEYDYVFHLAAIVGGRSTIENNPLAVAEDLSIDSQMWQWVAKSPVPKVVNFSSSAAYPINLQSKEGETLLLEESMIDFTDQLGMPDLSYGWAKMTSEYLGLLAWEKYGIRSVSYRPFSGFGPDQDLAYPFPSICLRAIQAKNKDVFEVWGSGKQARDFIHIDDCIEGVLLTMDVSDDGSAINLSTGIATTFFDLARMINASLGLFPEIRGNINMPTGVATRCGDTKKQYSLGFTKRSSLQDGITQTLEFLSQKF